MLSETTKMVMQLAAMIDVEGVEAKHAKSVIPRRQPFALVGEQVRPSEIDLFARHQIPEFAQVHESPQHGVPGRFFLAPIRLDGHLFTLPFYAVARRQDFLILFGTPRGSSVRSSSSYSVSGHGFRRAVEIAE